MFAQLGRVMGGLLRIKVGTASRITGSSIDKKQGIERRDLLHAGSALRSQLLLIWGRLQNLDPLHTWWCGTPLSVDRVGLDSPSLVWRRVSIREGLLEKVEIFQNFPRVGSLLQSWILLVERNMMLASHWSIFLSVFWLSWIILKDNSSKIN